MADDKNQKTPASAAAAAKNPSALDPNIGTTNLPAQTSKDPPGPSPGLPAQRADNPRAARTGAPVTTDKAAHKRGQLPPMVHAGWRVTSPIKFKSGEKIVEAGVGELLPLEHLSEEDEQRFEKMGVIEPYSAREEISRGAPIHEDVAPADDDEE